MVVTRNVLFDFGDQSLYADDVEVNIEPTCFTHEFGVQRGADKIVDVDVRGSVKDEDNNDVAVSTEVKAAIIDAVDWGM